MSRRSRAREVALQLLFQKDANKVAVPRSSIETFVKERCRNAELEGFAISLYDGVENRKSEIDEKIVKTAENWRLSRMMPADRNCLRLAIFELLYDTNQQPTAAIIDEAIELAKRFGTKDSGSFVNGILDKIAQERNATESKPETDTSS